MRFKLVSSPVVVLARAAVRAFSVRVDEDLVPGEWVYSTLAGSTRPSVFGALEPDVPVRGVKAGANRMLTIRALGAVHAPSSHERRELGDCNPVNLFGQNMVDPLLQVRNLCLEPLYKAASNLSKEHTCLGERI